MRPTWQISVAVAALVLIGPLVGEVPHGAAATPPKPGIAASAPPLRTLPAIGPSPATPSAEWPTYLANPERASANPWERTLSASNISQLTERWNYSTGDSVFASAAIVNGTVYLGSWDGYEYALNASTGALVWKANLGLSPSCYVGGIDSSATVWNGTVYVGGGNDHWYALNAANGSVEWSLNVLHYGSTTGNFDWISPLLYHGYEYIGLASCSDSPLVQGKLLEVNLTGNHSVVREFDAAPNGEIGVTIWETPSVDPATNTIWLATGNEGQSGQPYAESMVALNATTLTVLGHYEVPGVVGLDDDFGSGPTLFNDSSGRPLVIAVNKDGTDYAFNRSNVTSNGTWRPVWTFDAGVEYAPSAFDGSRLFVAAGSFTDTHHVSWSSSVCELDPATGVPVWRAGLPGSGTIIGGLAYADNLLFVPDGGDLDAVNASDGTLLKRWSLPTASGDEIDGTPTVLNGEVIFGAGNYGPKGLIVALSVPLSTSITIAPANSTPPGELAFHGHTTGGVPAFNFTWTFGDGVSGYGPSPTHLYEFPGNYTVVLTVNDSAGDVVNATVFALVVSSPTPLSLAMSATPTRGYSPLPVNFTGAESAGVAPVELQLNFGDGSTPVTLANTSHTYALPGTYEASLVAVDGWGRSAAQNITITVIAPLAVVATAGPLTGTGTLNVTFVDLASGGTAPYQATWEFGDGSPVANVLTVVHEYGAGTFVVHNSVTDAGGLSANHSFTVVVLSSTAPPPPIPLASTAILQEVGVNCSTNTTTWEATAAASGGEPPYAYAWTFGDGSAPVPGANATHAFRVPGGYGVVLNVTDATGATLLNVTALTVTPTGCVPAASHPSASSGVPYLPFLIGAGIGVVLALVIVLLWARRRLRAP